MPNIINLEHQSVRDLAWVMDSPGLLSKNNTEALAPVEDQWCKKVSLSAWKWLQSLDKNPKELDDWLLSKKCSRLGDYFAFLVEFWLMKWFKVEKLVSSQQIFDENRTVGEFDFLFYSEEIKRDSHWEVSVKFYLQSKNEGSLNVFIGPNAWDSLYKKFDKVLNQQIKLKENSSARTWLDENDYASLHSQFFFKGYLFYPVNNSCCQQNDLPEEVAPNHLKGWWCHYPLTSESRSFLLRNRVKAKWYVLPKEEWLSPVVKSIDDPHILDGEKQLFNALEEYFFEKERPLMIVEMASMNKIKLCERTRGFIVPEIWPGV
ncbi:MAG: hypothetical protein ACI9S8_000140 [Chlamydiales bacterium]|jgi:hypothetical protein